jgi:peptide/nickel transport system substrate-binding protein
VKKNPNGAVEETTGYGHYTFTMMVDRSPFDNNDVRLALKYAVNRDEIANKVFLGHAKPGNDKPHRTHGEIRDQSATQSLL